MTHSQLWASEYSTVLSELQDRAELLDNNFRNLMKKDQNNDDKGEDYVKKVP